MVRPFLSVIIPALNEAARLPLTLIDIDHKLSTSDYSYEIVVVDDGSTDETAGMVGRFTSLIKNLRVIRIAENVGKGAAIREGMKEARGNWRLFMDADSSISVTEFNKMIPFIQEDHDIIIASRIKESRIKNFPILRRLIEFKLNAITRLLLKSKVKDFLIGFHCFSNEAADGIFPQTRLNHADLQIEAIVLGERLGFSVKEVPVRASHRLGSRFNFFNYFRFFFSVLKMRSRLSRDFRDQEASQLQNN